MSAEDHVTTDPHTGLIDPQPLRHFTVVAKDGKVTEVRAHIANQTALGALLFSTLSGGLAFTTDVFAPGQWARYEGSVPSPDEVRGIKAYAQRQTAINQMLMHDAKTTRQ